MPNQADTKNTKPDATDQPESALRRLWVNWIKPIGIALIVVLSVRSALADWNDVPTGSMNPTIVEGDRVFVNKLAYGLKLPFTSYWVAEWGEPERGDIVTFWAPDNEVRMVKRVVAVPGDTFMLRHGRLYINGEAATYTPQPEQLGTRLHSFAEQFDGRHRIVQFASRAPNAPIDVRNVGPVTLGPNEFFLLGDNRDNSKDSRFFGPVTRDRIIGRTTRIVLSVDSDQFYRPRWERWFSTME